MKNRKGILFDLDGTLWEVTDITYKSANQIAQKYNLKEISIETIRSVFGLNKEDSAKLYFPYLNIEKAIKLIDEIEIININNLTKYGGNLYSNLENVLIKLSKKYELFIVSNTGNIEYIEAFLTTSKLKQYFSGYVAASALNISKAKAIQNVIEANGLKNAIYVGDTMKDLESSKIVGIPFIWAKYGFGNKLQTKYYINEISELPNIIEEIIE